MERSYFRSALAGAFLAAAGLLLQPSYSRADSDSDWPTLGQFLSSLVDRESEKADDPVQAEKDLWLISVDPLPNCKEAKVRLEEVFAHSAESDRFDMLYYNPYDRDQVRRATEWPGNVTGYEPKLYLEREERRPDFWQDFARLTKVSCLPTRFRFSYVGSHRYREFREGERAWDE